MDIRIICIGDELLSGDTLNTNLIYVGDKLSRAGLRIQAEVCVPDEEAHLKAALQGMQGADVIITIGGLGPTRDDMTRPVTAAFLGRKLIMDEKIRQGIADYLGQRSRVMPQESLSIQAEVPEGAEILPNHNGTAPGLLMTDGGTSYFLLPGPPREMRPMFDNYVLPRILSSGEPEYDERTMRIIGVGESIVESTVRNALGEDADRLHLAYCIKADNVMVKIARRHGDESIDLDGAFRRVTDAFGWHRIPENCVSAAAYLGELLRERGLTLSTAESCTGGGIATALTDIPGSSKWFSGAFVTYANEWKMNALGVNGDTLEKYGAVSAQTVSQMLDGLLARGGTDLGMAVSGIAGPDGGTAEKPVGTVYVGIAGHGWQRVSRMHFNGLRDTVRSRTANAAISMMIVKLMEG